MKNDWKPVTLLSHVPLTHGQSVAGWLGSMGRRVDVVCTDDWLRSGHAAATDRHVLLLADSDGVGELAAVIGRLQSLDWIGVFDGPSGAAARARAVDTIGESAVRFIAWPSEEAALAAWLAGEAGSATAPGVHGQAQRHPGREDLLAEFARLNLVGQSPAFLRCLELIRRSARSAAPVLLQGETGTGKDLAARAIHSLGPRAGGPFIPVNCGAIPDTLVESELFGHEKGAFTGAGRDRAGLVAQAAGGTLFLDEVDALSPKAQVVLLRFLQDQSYRPVGGRRSLQASAAIVAASNADLDRLAAEGRFRRDLLFRLAIVTLRLPPLRERPGDIALLARHILRKLGAQYGESKSVAPSALAGLHRHPWPGNVRELENVLHRAYVVSAGNELHPDDLMFGPDGADAADADSAVLDGLPFREAKARAVAEFERRYLRQLIAEAGGNITRAADRCGKDRRALGKLLKKHRIAAQLADACPAGDPRGHESTSGG